mgnify:CR=1 FL=1
MKPVEIFNENQLKKFEEQCRKAKFSTFFNEWIKTPLNNMHVGLSPKSSFSLWVFDRNIDKDDAYLEKILVRLDKL